MEGGAAAGGGGARGGRGAGGGTHLAQHELHVAELAALPQPPVVLVQRTLGVTGELRAETPLLGGAAQPTATRAHPAPTSPSPGPLASVSRVSAAGRPTWNLYISPLRMLLSTVPPKMYMASEMTAAA